MLLLGLAAAATSGAACDTALLPTADAPGLPPAVHGSAAAWGTACGELAAATPRCASYHGLFCACVRALEPTTSLSECACWACAAMKRAVDSAARDCCCCCCSLLRHQKRAPCKLRRCWRPAAATAGTS
ncbi:hypothetical protein COO60DRAFT_1473879 [Scenedesmus sp. NREL 46B-D3]|nr:hypothetical protein COO60DRAFT_1473879 [Scenedesmus sp. NREL 46B-D3]